MGVSASNLQQCYYFHSIVGGDYNSYTSTEEVFFGHSIYGSTYTTIIKFTTPNFIESPNKIKITLSVIDGISGNVGSHNYTLCTSDANKNLYKNMYNEIPQDSYKIIEGTFSESATEFTIDVSNTEIKRDTTYYIYIFGGSVVQLNGAKNHEITLCFPQGVVFIDDGNGLHQYTCYIDNGTTWDRYEPYVSIVNNGTLEWKRI